MPASRLSRLHALLPWAVVALAGAFALRQLDDADTWWHLAAGRSIVENGAVPHTDTLSYTVRDHAWINLQWLFDLALYGLYRLGGANALVVAAAAFYTSTFAVLVAHLRRWLGPLGSTVLASGVLLACQDRFAVRPEMVSFLFLQIVLWLVGTAKESEGRRLWLLAPLMLLWANSHALFAVGLFVIACTVLVALAAERAPHLRRRLWIAAGLAGCATLATPYLTAGATFPLELLSRLGASPFAPIGELASPFAAWFPDLTIGVFQLLFVAGCAIAVAAAVVEFDLAGTLVFVGLTCLAALAYRNAALFALGAAPFLARSLSVIRDRLPRGPERAVPAAGAVFALALAAMFWLVPANRYYRADGRTHEFGLGVLEATFPIRAADFVEEVDLPGPLYNDLTAGGYLAWARPNGERVFIDGRLEVYDEFFGEYSAGLRDPAVWAGQAERFAFGTVVLFHGWPNRHPLIAWLDQNPAWSLVYFDEAAAVFVRTAGHATEIARARGAFAGRYDETLRRLEAPVATWRYPVGRVTSWTALGALFQTLGDPARAADCYEAVLAFDLPSRDALSIRLWLVDYSMRSGDRARAQAHLDRALRIDAADERVRQWREALGS